MKRKIPMETGDEYDLFTSWKQFYRWKPGQRRKDKGEVLAFTTAEWEGLVSAVKAGEFDGNR